MTNGELKACCTEAANRERVEVREPFTVERCTVCGCRHYTLALDLAEVFGLKGPRAD